MILTSPQVVTVVETCPRQVAVPITPENEGAEKEFLPRCHRSRDVPVIHATNGYRSGLKKRLSEIRDIGFPDIAIIVDEQKVFAYR